MCLYVVIWSNGLVSLLLLLLTRSYSIDTWCALVEFQSNKNNSGSLQFCQSKTVQNTRYSCLLKDRFRNKKGFL